MNIAPAGLTPPRTPPIDFTVIDQPAEALVLPGVDLFVRLAAGRAEHGSVSAELGGQPLNYSWCGPEVAGENIELKPQDCTNKQFEGHVGANKLSEAQDSAPGQLRVSGTAAAVAFDEQLYLDPSYGMTNHYASVYATVGDQLYSAEIYRNCEGYQLCGTLGDQEVCQKLVMNPNGGGEITGHIGGVPLHEIITVS